LHAEWLERRLALAATPTASLSAPDGFIGAEIPLSVTFDNTGTDIGYGPFIDVIMPASGNAPPLPNNGVSFKTSSATYLGAAVPTTVLTFGPTGQVNHPFAKNALGNPVVISGDPGDQLVVFQLPFGSYGPAQPPATVSFTGIISNGAQPGSDYDVTARGGFQYQVDGSGNPTVDRADFGATATDPVEPQLFTIAKTSSAPEGETATGPNFTHTYTVTVSVAPGQTLTNFTLTDVLPNNVQFVLVNSVTANGDPTPTQTSVPSTTVPGGTLSYLFDQVNGTGGNDISLTYSFFMPEYSAGGADVIPLETGGTATATNSAGGSATWQNTNPNFPPTQFVVGTPASTTVTGKTLALQKSASASQNPARAGDTITYTLSFQVSDYFALTNFTIDDLLTDGQDFDTSFTPTLAFTQKGETLAAQAFDALNYAVDATFTNGTTTVDFNVSAELLRRGLTTGTKLVGAGIGNTGTGGDDPDPLPETPGTTGTITFKTIIRNTYRATGDEVVQGDVVGNTATTDSTVLNFTNLTPTTSTFSDGSGATTTLAVGGLQKTVHAVNGSTVTGVPVVKPGDTVTFRLTYNLPFSSIGQYVLTDFLPLPIFEAGNLTFAGGPSATLPGTGQWSFGPLDSFSQPDPPGIGGPVPTTSFSVAANSVSWNFGTFEDNDDRDGVTDIFFTVTATARPFADGLLLTNQGLQTEVTSQGQELSKTAIAQVQVVEPLLAITKGVVATNDASGVFSPMPSAPAGVTFSAPGSSPSFTGTVTSNGLAATPIVAALSNVGANDLVTFAIVIENTGRSPNGAFDVTFRDTFDATKLQIPAGGLNLQVRDGAGTLLPFTTLGAGLFDAGGGILLNDGVTGSLGPGKTTGGTVINTGTNIAVITYDLQLKPNVQPSDVATNTATLSNYASQEGGPNFIPNGLQDTTTVTVAEPTVVKTLVSTSIVNANNSNTQAVIGELATYTITVTVPQGEMPTAQVIDSMPTGLAYVRTVSAVNNSPATLTIPNLASLPTVTSNGRTITYDLGTIVNSDTDSTTDETFTITIEAVVLNTTGNVRGTTLTNQARTTWNAGADQTANVSSGAVTVIEPTLTVVKTASPTTGQAGDTITYTIVVENPAGTNRTDAYDVTLEDLIPSGVTYVPGSWQNTVGTAPTTISDAGPLAATWSTFALGATSTFTFQATLDYADTPGQQIVNEADVAWTSLPGSPGQISTFNSNSYERTGSGSTTLGQLNNYTATDDATVTIVSPTVAKTLVSTSIVNAANSNTQAVIGELATYTITVTVPQGTMPTAQVIDSMPTGLAYVRTVSAVNNSPATLTIPNLANLPTVTSNGQTITYDLGTILNSDADPTTDETFTITIEAVVLNTTGNVRGTTLTNQARTTWNAGANQTSNVSSGAVTVIEPTLTVTKTASPTTGQAADTITYTIVVANPTGTNRTDAYEATLQDLVPTGMTYVPGSWRNTAGTVPTTISDAGAPTLTATWSTFALGDTSTFTFQATLDLAVTPAQQIVNNADAAWESLPTDPGQISTFNSNSYERTGSGSTTLGQLNNYTATDDATVTIVSPTVAKTLVSTSIENANNTRTQAVIGETAVYRLAVTVPQGTMPTSTIIDTLPAGLAFVEVVGTPVVSAGVSIQNADWFTTPGNLTVGTGGQLLTFNLGTVTNSDTDSGVAETIVVDIRAVVLNLTGNTSGTTLVNQAQATWNAGANQTAVVTAETVTVIEPDMEVEKTVSVGGGGGNVGDTVTYTIVIRQAAGSETDAFNVTLADTIPAQIGSPTIASVVDTSGLVTASAFGIASNVLSTTGTGFSFAKIPGRTITLTVTGTLTGISAAQTITNTAAIQWTSLDGSPGLISTFNANSYERTGSGSTTLGQVNDYAASDAAAFTTRSADLAVAKTVSNATPNVGDTITFTITVTNNGPDGATGVELTDTFPTAELLILSATPSQGSFTSGTGVWVVGSLASGASATLEISARVLAPTTAGAAPSTQTNVAQITKANEPDPNPNNNRAEVSETPQYADLVVTKTVNNPTPNVNAAVQFTITVQNLGADSATNVTLSDLLPNGLRFDGATPGGSTTYSSTTGVWNVGTLAVGSSVTLTIDATVLPPSSGAPLPKTNTASVATSDQYDPNPGNNQSSATVTPLYADVSIAKTVSDAAPYLGDTITYTLVVRNDGPNTAQNVSVADTFPTAGLADIVALAPTVGTYDPVTKVWTIGPLTNGQTASLAFTARTIAVGTFVNTATVTTSTYDPDTNDQTAQAEIQTQVGGVITGTDFGCESGPIVRVVDPRDGRLRSEFFAYEPSFRGGVRVYGADITGDGIPEILTAPGPGRPGEVRVFTRAGVPLPQFTFMPFGASYISGVEVAAGSVTGAGRYEIVAGQSRGQGLVRVFTVNAGSVNSSPIRQMQPFGARFRGGVTVATADVGTFSGANFVSNAPNNIAEIIVGSGAGIPAEVRAFNAVPVTPARIGVFRVMGGSNRGVSVSKLPGATGVADRVLVAGGQRSGGQVQTWRQNGGQFVRDAAFVGFGGTSATVFAAALDAENIFTVEGVGGRASGVRKNTAPSGGISSAVPGTSTFRPPLRVAALRR